MEYESIEASRNANEQIAVWGRLRYTVIGSLDEISRRCGYSDWSDAQEQGYESIGDLVSEYLHCPDFYQDYDEFEIEELNTELY